MKMNRKINFHINTLLIVILLHLGLYGSDFNLPAFPGAEGFGAETIGGRGGTIFEVTNLNDQGPGSFRAACESSGPRIIVFRTGGMLVMSTKLDITNPFVTIAGQTAPGDGICIGGGGLFKISTHDVIVRNLRLRPGDNPEGVPGDSRDGIGIGGDDAYNIIVDHCSVSWGIDENIQIYEAKNHVTIQYCISSEALSNSLHSKGVHGMGFLSTTPAGGADEYSSVHHNLIASCNRRNPRVALGTSELINNVIYNWGGAGLELGRASGGTGKPPGPVLCNIIGNTFKKGPDSGNELLHQEVKGSKIYSQDNVGIEIEKELVTDPVFIGSGITTQPSNQAYEIVLGKSGAIVPKRDATDTRIVNDVTNGTGKIIDCVDSIPLEIETGTAQEGTTNTITLDTSASDGQHRYMYYEIEIVSGKGSGQVRTIIEYPVLKPPVAKVDTDWDTIPDSTSQYRIFENCQTNAGGWPSYDPGIPPIDTDHDGMPDAWEQTQSLNPNDNSDAHNTNLSPEGYTNIEVYINSLFDGSTGTIKNPSIIPYDKRFNCFKNASTSSIIFTFNLFESSEIRIDIFSLQGKRIKKITRKTYGPGNHSIVWNNRKEKSRLHGNLYLVRFKSSNYVQIKRLVVF